MGLRSPIKWKHEAPGLRTQTPGATTTNDRLDPAFHPDPARFWLVRLLWVKWLFVSQIPEVAST